MITKYIKEIRVALPQFVTSFRATVHAVPLRFIDPKPAKFLLLYLSNLVCSLSTSLLALLLSLLNYELVSLQSVQRIISSASCCSSFNTFYWQPSPSSINVLVRHGRQKPSRSGSFTCLHTL